MLALVALMIGPLPAAAREPGHPSAFRMLDPVPGRVAVAAGTPVDLTRDRNLRGVPAVRWPAVGYAEVSITGARTGAGMLPVRVGPATFADGVSPRGATPGRVSVTVLGRTAAERLGVSGVVLRLARADGVPADGRVWVELDYSAFRDAYGGGWADRLRLLSVPQCAATDPADVDCQPVPLSSTNDVTAGRVSAEVDASATASGTLIALDAAPSGSGGDYSATPLAASGTWSAGGSSGDFNWTYPMRTPPGLNGPEPQLALAYSSGSLDGRTAASNSQPSWAGDGFDLSTGAVSRAFKACADDGQTGVGDLCWGGENATLSLAGHTGELIQDAGNARRWHLRGDDGTLVEQLTGTVNGDQFGEYWKVTTTEGMQYFFGLNRLPGWTTNRPETGSAWTVPVFGNQAGEPCNSGAGFAASSCPRAYRWNLDYVVDPHGNTMSLWYSQETNRYARNRSDTAVSAYTRGGTLARIDYGTRRDGGVDSGFATPAPMRVIIETGDRCVTSGVTCTLTKANAANWPDVPIDLLCTSTTSCPGLYTPTFWATKRLASVTTQVRRGAGYADVERWRLRHVFKDPGDGHAKTMWLEGISHAGLVGMAPGTETAVPDVTFTGVQLRNRVDRSSSKDPIIRFRVASIANEAGSVVSVNYSQVDCVLGSSMPASPESNDRRCFPIYWTPPGLLSPALDWFHKYVVTSVTEADGPGLAPMVTTTYQYLSPPAWHYDEAEFVPASRKSWGQWRGYGKVRTVRGAPDGIRSQTDTLYFRGMHGDKLPSGTRVVSVIDSDGGSLPDSAWRQGQTREVIVYNGIGDTAPVVSKTKHDPWQFGPTASRNRNGVLVEAYATGVSTSTVKTALDGGRGWRTSTVTRGYDYDDGSANPTGRVTRFDDAGDLSTTADDRCTRLSYAVNTGAYMFVYPVEAETVSVRCAATPNRATDTISRARARYDGAVGFGTTVSLGDQTLVERMTDWNGGNPVYQPVVRATYDAYGRARDVFDQLGNKTSTVYSPGSGGPLLSRAVTNPLNWTTSETYDPAFGLTTHKVDENGRRTELAYDGLGRLTHVWLPGRDRALSASLTFGYTMRRTGGPSYVNSSRLNTAGDGYLTTFTLYDGLLRPRQVKAPAVGGGSIVTDTLYDGRGLVAGHHDPYFIATAPGGSLFVPSGPVPSATWLEYDSAGRSTASIRKVNGVERWRTRTYYGGDHVDTTPPAGGIATADYTDARGQRTELRQYRGGAPTGGYDLIRYSYTAAGKGSSIVDAAGNTWSWTYDQLGRMRTFTEPDRGTTYTTYDTGGRIATVRDARGTTLAYAYDSVGRRTGEYLNSTSGTPLATWTYDTVLKGQLTSATRWVNQQPYVTAVAGYDAAYRPTGTTLTIPTAEGGAAGSYTGSSTYNADGSVATITMPAIGGLPEETVTYKYNDVGLQTGVTGEREYLTNTAYDQLGRLGSLTRTNAAGRSVIEEWAYDGTGRVVEHAAYGDTTPQVLTDAHYRYDNAGNVTGIADLTDQYGSGPDDVQCFRYDQLRRLTEAWTPNSTDCAANPSAAPLGGPAPYWQSWTFDATGNRLTQTDHAAGGNTTQTSTYPAAGQPRRNAVSTVRTTGPGVDRTDTFAYDEMGNTTRRAGQTLTWDPEGRLATVVANGQTSSYVYDADGNRILERTPGGTTVFSAVGECRVAGTGPLTCTRLYSGAGRVVAVRTGNAVTWSVGDHQNTAQISVDAASLAVTRRRTTPYGGIRGANPAWPSRHGFVDGVVDATGLVHLGAREYDPALGRFISVDPLLNTDDPQQFNGYVYAADTPTTGSDPDGLVMCPDGDCRANPPPKPKAKLVELATRTELVSEQRIGNRSNAPVKSRTVRTHKYYNNNGQLEDHRGCLQQEDYAGRPMPGPMSCAGKGVTVLGPIAPCKEGNTAGSVCYKGADGYTYDIDGGMSCAKDDFNFCGRPPSQPPASRTCQPPASGPKIGPAPPKHTYIGPAPRDPLAAVKSAGVCINGVAGFGMFGGVSGCVAIDRSGIGVLGTRSGGFGGVMGGGISGGVFVSDGDVMAQKGDSNSASFAPKFGAGFEAAYTESLDGTVRTGSLNLGGGPEVSTAAIFNNKTYGTYLFQW